MPLRASIVQYLKLAWLLAAQFDKVDEEFLRGGLKTHPMGPIEPSDERTIVSYSHQIWALPVRDVRSDAHRCTTEVEAFERHLPTLAPVTPTSRLSVSAV
jgi:hypothetical protein